MADILYGNSIAGILVSMFTSCVLVLGFHGSAVDQFKQVWLVLMTLVLTTRLVDSIWWRIKQRNTDYDGKKAVYRFIVGLHITSIMWCVYGLTVFDQVDNIELATIIVSFSALAGGGATLLAAHKNAAIIYAFTLLCPLATALLFTGEHYKQLLGVMGVSFSFVMVLITKKASNFTMNAIALKNENAVLVQDMEAIVEKRTKKIYELSNLDPLTGLFNRTAFLQHLDEQLNICIQEEQPLALLFIDLDGFKKINDTLGHEIGDQLLTQTAERLKEHCPDNQLLCRWGGDEFLIAVSNLEEAAVLTQAMQFISDISRAYIFKKNHLSISATIGISMYPQHADTAHELIQLADTAMYYQKRRGPSMASVFSDHLGQQLFREQKLRDGLSEAVEKEQLRLVFQPIVSSDNGKVGAFEALLRWRLDEEEIYPDEFISVAEQYGYICKIGAWVLYEACLTASKWDRDKKLAVSVNVSVTQLEDENFLSIVEVALSKSQLPAELLHIEITESVFANDKDMVLEQIKVLQNKGIKVSIDDFGTGYSSLSVMQDLAVNIVKIDRSFVEKLDSNGPAIINAVINIAQTLDYLVVVEGVETIQQAKTLSGMGVHFQQGFYYAKPMEQDQVEQFLIDSTEALSPDFKRINSGS